MKKVFALILAVSLLWGAALAEGSVTIREWLDAEGQCGDCQLTVTVREVLNPVWAAIEDGTAETNLFGVAQNGDFYGFGENGFQAGDRLVLANPTYNVFEGTVEMADSQLADIVVEEEGFRRVTIQEWLDCRGETGSAVVIAKVLDILNPMWAVISDGSAEVHLFGVTLNGEMNDFGTAGVNVGDLLVLVNPRFNEFEGTVEMADANLFRLISKMVKDE